MLLTRKETKGEYKDGECFFKSSSNEQDFMVDVFIETENLFAMLLFINQTCFGSMFGKMSKVGSD